MHCKRAQTNEKFELRQRDIVTAGLCYVFCLGNALLKGKMHIGVITTMKSTAL